MKARTQWILGGIAGAALIILLVAIIVPNTYNTGIMIGALDRNTETVGGLSSSVAGLSNDVVALGDRVTTLEGTTKTLETKGVVAKVDESILESSIQRIITAHEEDRVRLIEGMIRTLPPEIIAGLVQGGYISLPSTAPTPVAATTASPTATATPSPAPVVMSATPTVGEIPIPKETIYTLRIEQEKDGEKVLAILANLRNPFEDPGCPKDALTQPVVKMGELRRCLTTKTNLIQWLGVNALPAVDREWLVLGQTIFPVANIGEESLKRQPAFWFQMRPSTEDRLMVELKAGTVKIDGGGAADPGGEKIQPNGRILSKTGYLAWIKLWTKQEPPVLTLGTYAVYPFLIER